MVVRENEALVEEVYGLTDYELVAAFRNSNITNAYHFRDDVIRQTLTMEFAGQLDRGGGCMDLRGISHRIFEQ